MKPFIAIAGNNGAGKTCLAKKLATYYNWDLFQEPFQHNPYLENFYKDIKKWAFKTELAFLALRLKNHLAILKKDSPIIQDRCIYEGAEIFVKNQYLNNDINETDWQTYNALYQSIKECITPPTMIIYLKSSPERCLRNVQKRNWTLDKTMTLDYLERLNARYVEWVQNFNLCPILIANADQNDFKQNQLAFNQLAEQIKEMLNKLNY